MMRKVNTGWFIGSDQQTNAPLQLICFPHAGGAASAYHSWRKQLTVDLLAVQLPGREGRMKEPHIFDFKQAIQELADAYETDEAIRRDGRPVVFFGHSMGAILAYEVTHELARRKAELPMLLLVSGRAPPSHQPKEALLHPLPDEAFIDELDWRFGGVPAVLRDEPDLMALFLPILRADLTMLECHSAPTLGAVPVPIYAFGGRQDTRAPRHWLEDWAAHTSDFQGVQQFDGAHFYLHDANSGFLNGLAETLANHGASRTVAPVV